MRLILIVFIFILSGCATLSQPTNKSSLVGTWKMYEMPRVLPDSCSESETEYKSDGTLIMTSGPQVITADYIIEEMSDGGFILKQSNIRANGLPNCQGRPADYVLSRYLDVLYIKINRDIMVYYFDEKDKVILYTQQRL